MKFLVFLLLLAAASFGMTSLMTNQLLGSVSQVARKYQKSVDSPLASLQELEGFAQNAPGGEDGSAADPRRAALQKISERLGKKHAFDIVVGDGETEWLLKKKSSVMARAGAYLKKERSSVLPIICWGVPLVFMVLTLLSLLVFWYGIARLLCTFTFKFCTLTLSVMSLAILTCAAAGKPEFIAAIPRDMWFAPILFILGSSVVMKLVDLNYPVWNAALKAFGFPIISSAAVMALTYFKA